MAGVTAAPTVLATVQPATPRWLDHVNVIIIMIVRALEYAAESARSIWIAEPREMGWNVYF
jgi:hypothetical protein